MGQVFVVASKTDRLGATYWDGGPSRDHGRRPLHTPVNNRLASTQKLANLVWSRTPVTYPSARRFSDFELIPCSSIPTAE